MKNQLFDLLLVIPAAFFFHFYEYNERKVLGGEASLLLPGSIIIILTVAILTLHIKTLTFMIWPVVSLGLSLILAAAFIPDDPSWFKPFGLYFAIIFIHVVYVLAVLLIRMIGRALIKAFS
ncbi:MAG TPA: hypothetical protein GX525_07325 [Bacilli bacterium]|nr:hypothetical protein [Bacilli bacterium]